MEVQTRSEENGIFLYSDVKSAYKAWENDKTILKISWQTDKNVRLRFIPKTKNDKWNPKSEEKLREMSEEYKNSNPEQLFWVDQKMLPDNYDEISSLRNTLSKEEYECLWLSSCICEIVTDEEFKRKYVK